MAENNKRKYTAFWLNDVMLWNMERGKSTKP